MSRISEPFDGKRPKNSLKNLEVNARILDSKSPVQKIELSGSFQMKHSFYHKDDDYLVNASFSGYVDADRRTHKVARFRMATVTAEYGSAASSKLPFGVVVREIP